jgi:hypothetical protein
LPTVVALRKSKGGGIVAGFSCSGWRYARGHAHREADVPNDSTPVPTNTYSATDGHHHER